VHSLLKQVSSGTRRTCLLLPFAVSSKERTLPFTEEDEIAIIYCIAESDRRKGEGVFIKKPAEELAFIAKFCYPIWLVPWNGKALLFDGLGSSTRTLFYEVLPDVKAFTGQIRGIGEKRQAYSAALADHAHYFESVKKVEERTALGLVTGSDFIQDFETYLTEAEEIEESGIREACLSPIVNEDVTFRATDKLSELKTTLDEEVQQLREAMKLVSSTTRQHVDAIRDETRSIQDNLGKKIDFAKSLAMEKIRQIQGKFDERILKTSQRFEKQLGELHQERVKLEKSVERAEVHIERCEAEVQAHKSRKDAHGERRWKEGKEKWKREISTLKKAVEALVKQIEETDSQKRIEISNLRAEFNALSEEAMKDVRELEATKDSKTQINQQEMKTLESLTSTILEQLDNLTTDKKSALNELDTIGMKQQRRKTALAYVPFYLAYFKAGAQHKYMVYPPSIASKMKTTTKFKGMLGLSKLKSLFQQRSRAVTNVLDQLITLAERDPVFEKDLYEAGVRSNILQTAESIERVQRGIRDLESEQWISNSEAQTLSASLKRLSQ
jgi:hypothetical protein